MKQMNKIVWLAWVAFVLAVLNLAFAVKSLGQDRYFDIPDSVQLKITRIGTMEDKKVYWLKNIETKERYVTICDCKTERKKGDKVMIAKKDLIITKDSFTKKDL